MTMTLLQIDSNRRNDLTDTYVWDMINQMNNDMLEQLCHDLLMESMTNLSDYELCEEVYDYLGQSDETFKEFAEQCLTDDEVNSYLDDANVVSESRN